MNRNEFKKLISERVLILDGATGTELQKRGYLKDIGAPEELNIKAPERIVEIHRDYLEAGAEIIFANTFGANRLKLADYGLADKLIDINQSGIKIAKDIAQKYNAFVAADIGPLGAYISPLGHISFDEAYSAFSEQIKALNGAKPDLLVIETMAEIREVKAAILATKDNFNGPVLVQMTFTSDGTTVTGTDVLSFLSICESMGVDGVGMNCSVGPKDLATLSNIIASNSSLAISFKPNAGMPKLVNRETVFPGTAEEFVEQSVRAYGYGANMFGGCCGSTPEFIRALAKELKNKKPTTRAKSEHFFLSSRTKTIDLSISPFSPSYSGLTGVSRDIKSTPLDSPVKPGNDKELIMIGERINPTNRKKFQEELLLGNFAILRREAQEQVKSGANILDINLGLPGANEQALMTKAVEELQEVVSVPLCLDSSSSEVLEAGLKACAGKPLINSVNGDKHKLDVIVPLAKRYGAAVIGLCTDETGIPKTADERLKIAERIISAAKDHNFPQSEIVFDYLTLAASAMADQVKETLSAIKESKKRWPQIKTVLGVSNVSFGLPARQILNSTFLKLARASGLDMAILNPHEDWTIDDELAKNLLLGNDPSGAKYIQKYGNMPKKAAAAEQEQLTPDKKLYDAVLEGNREEIGRFVDETLALKFAPLDIANNIILRALNDVGEKFGKKEYFLPQVILAAEAAQAAFAKIKPLLKKDSGFSSGKIILATVKGDVHDIGKNIVAAVLESHGWEVVDLGKNVETLTIISAAKKENAPVVGLSALMTTTMLEMEKVVQARSEEKLSFKILIGGAPVTERFAKDIGADGYAKDAVEAAKIAAKLIGR